MRRSIIWIELAIALVFLALAIKPFLAVCSGRIVGLDCESQAIFAVNLFAPIGLAALAAAILTWRRSGRAVHLMLLIAISAVLLRWLYFMLDE